MLSSRGLNGRDGATDGFSIVFPLRKPFVSEKSIGPVALRKWVGAPMVGRQDTVLAGLEARVVRNVRVRLLNVAIVLALARLDERETGFRRTGVGYGSSCMGTVTGLEIPKSKFDGALGTGCTVIGVDSVILGTVP